MYGWTDVTNPAVGIADGENVLAIFDHEPEAFINFADRLLQAPETSDFPKDAAHQWPIMNVHGAQTHFEEEIRSVFARASQLKPYPAWPQSRCTRVTGDLPLVFLPKRFRQYGVKMQAKQLVRSIAEEFFRLRVHVNDLTLVIRDEYSFRRGVKNGSGRSITERRSSLRHDSFPGTN